MYTLTREDLKAVRTAYNVSFHATPNAHNSEMVGTVRCTIKQPVFNKEITVEHDISAAVTLRQFPYDNSDGALEPNRWRGFDMIHSAQFSEEWTTIAKHILRVGDGLTLHFMRGGWCSEGLRAKRIVADTLYLVVNRKGADLFFVVGHYIGEDNTARMTQPHF